MADEVWDVILMNLILRVFSDRMVVTRHSWEPEVNERLHINGKRTVSFAQELHQRLNK